MPPRGTLPFVDPDFHVRLAAIDRLQTLQLRYDDMIPRREILENLIVDGQPYALFNPQAGIHRPRLFRGAAALTIVTAPPHHSKPPPYDDVFDEASGTIVYSYRQGSSNSADNRALRAAYVEQVPLIYLMGIAPSVYALAAPVFVVQDQPAQRSVLVQIGSRATHLTPAGIRSDADVCRWAFTSNGSRCRAIHRIVPIPNGLGCTSTRSWRLRGGARDGAASARP